MSDDFQAAQEEQKTAKRHYPPLDNNQVDFAYDQIQYEIHPIAKTPPYEAFPWLLCCTRCCFTKKAQAQEAAAEEALLMDEQKAPTTMKALRAKPTKVNIKAKEGEKEEELMRLGFGIYVYLNLMKQLIFVFLMLSVLAIPSFIYFSQNNAYKSFTMIDGVKTEIPAGDELYSLGNLGYASVQCVHAPLEVGAMSLSCQYGTIGKILDWGSNYQAAQNVTTNPIDLCKNNPWTKPCKPDNAKATLEAFVGLDAATFSYKKEDLWKNITAIPSACRRDDNQLFVQYTCVIDESGLFLRYQAITLMVWMGLLMALLFYVYTRFAACSSNIQGLEFDLDTITAQDYSVEFKINKQMFELWKETDFDPNGKEAPMMALKNHMAKKIEHLLVEHKETFVAHLNEANQEQAAEEKKKKEDKKKKKSKNKERMLMLMEERKYKVADIAFAYNNEKLIQLLVQRGKAIKTLQFDDMRSLEAEIDSVKNESTDGVPNFELWTIPACAFVTFETDDAKEMALDLAEAYTKLCENEALVPSQNMRDQIHEDFKLVGDHCWDAATVTDAPDPTDIIWENRHFTDREILLRSLLVFSVCIGLLVGSFFLLLAIAQGQIRYAVTFPPVECSNIEQQYGSRIEEYAFKDADFVLNPANAGLASSGCLQCFCAMPKTDTFPHDKDMANIKCDQYSKASFNALLMNSCLGYVIVGVNYVIRTVMIMMITWIGYASETEQLTKITSFTFYMLFFNTAFLLMLVNADLSEQPLTFGLTQGHYADFNASWWKAIGNPLLSTMFINAIFPIAEFVGFWFLRFLPRLMDRGWTFNTDKYNTRATSIMQYVDLYAGPEFLMHFKYSAILNIVFVTFMYGLALPMLFLYAVLAIAILWFSEELLFYYSYRLPPMYDESLAKNVMAKMKTAPVFMLLFGYWFFSSNQLLQNDKLHEYSRQSDTAITGHTMSDVFSKEGWLTPAAPLLLAGILLIIHLIFGDYLGEALAKCFPSLKIGDVELNEEIDTYWNSLDDHDRKWSIAEEEHWRLFSQSNLSALGVSQGSKDFQMLEQDSYTHLKSSKEGEKTLQGTHSYDILCNPKYYGRFNYIPVAQDEGDERADFIIDDDSDEGNDDWQSDKVRVGLNLGFLPEVMAQNLKFTYNGKPQKDEDKINSLM